MEYIHTVEQRKHYNRMSYHQGNKFKDVKCFQFIVYCRYNKQFKVKCLLNVPYWPQTLLFASLVCP